MNFEVQELVKYHRAHHILNSCVVRNGGTFEYI